MTTLFIKNLVCNRCVLVVKQKMEHLGLHPVAISLGEVTLAEDPISPDQIAIIDEQIRPLGFEVIDDHKARLIEAIKNKIITMIHHSDKVNLRFNWSVVLSQELHYEYNYLSNLFSSIQGTTLEQYIIRQKIEKTKELLFYDELNLSEIADRLGYSSVAHLSAQFKKVTGITPSELKKSRNPDQTRTPIDRVQ